MSKEKPTYTMRVEHGRYFAAFKDSLGNRQEIEIPHDIFIALEECRKHEKRQANAFERHIEHMELSETQLSARMSIRRNALKKRSLKRLMYTWLWLC